MPSYSYTRSKTTIHKVQKIREWSTSFQVWCSSPGRFATRRYVNGYILTTDNDINYEEAVDNAYQKTISRVYQCCTQIERGIPTPGPYV